MVMMMMILLGPSSRSEPGEKQEEKRKRMYVVEMTVRFILYSTQTVVGRISCGSKSLVTLTSNLSFLFAIQFLAMQSLSCARIRLVV